MAAAAETLQSHLEFVLDGRVGELTSDQRRFLDVAVRYGDRLVRLAEDMRTVALVEAGELEPEHGRFDLVRTVQGVVEHAWPAAHVEGKSFGVQHEGPVWVDGDEQRLVRALQGLVADAVDLAQPGTFVTLVVRDGGVEIAYEGDKEPAGSGLALGEAIARLHGGELSLRVADGTIFLGLSLGASAPVPAAA